MKTIGLMVLVVGLVNLAALGQATPPPLPPEIQKLEDQAKDLMTKMQQPDFDFTQFRDQMRGLMQQFNDATQNMDPDKVNELRQQMMDRMRPAIQEAMPKIMQKMQQSMVEGFKNELGCTDEEFTVLRPLLQKVVENLRVLGLGSGGGRGRGGFGGPGGPPPGQSSELQSAREELHNTLEDSNASPTDVKRKLDTYRLAKEKARQELELSRNQLKQLLTVRQESVLVNAGILE
jgi:exonuclease VII large subunit